MPFQKGNKLGGRKKANHTLQAEALKMYIVQEVIKEKKPLIEALITKAKGGDVSALKEILDRILGRSKESLDLTSDGKSIIITFDEAFSKRNGKQG